MAGPDQIDEAESGPKRLAVRVTKDAARQLRGGHPWVFDGSVLSVKPEGSSGDLAVIFDDRRQFLAIGLYDPESPIRVKVLHHGKPKTIDDDFWAERLAAAAERRAGVIDEARTTGYRCVHGENDGLPGLVLDRYGDVFVLKLYSEAWLPHLSAVIDAVKKVFDPDAVVLRLSRGLQASIKELAETDVGMAGYDGRRLRDGLGLSGDVPDEPVRFLENGLRFEADVIHGQKTGFFLDQRDNRARVRMMSQGLRVLDVYSCSGSFSVSAAAGAAKSVHSVDISSHAIESAKRNMALNSKLSTVRKCSHLVSVGDAMSVMSQMSDAGRKFDMVIVDPPSFASRKSQVGGALRAYGRLTELACALLTPGGRLVQASCSARVDENSFVVAVTEGAERAGVRLDGLQVHGHAADHPVSFPQGSYLKAIFAVSNPLR